MRLLLILLICFGANAQTKMVNGMKVKGAEAAPFLTLSGTCEVSDDFLPVGREVIVYPVKDAVLMEKGTSFVGVLDKSLYDGDENIGFKLGSQPVKLTKLEAGKLLVWCVDCTPIAKPKPVVKKPVVKATTAKTTTIKGKGNIGFSSKNWVHRHRGLKSGVTYKYSLEVVKVSGSGKLQVGNSWSKYYNKHIKSGKVSGSFKVKNSKYESFTIGADEGTTYIIKNIKITQ